MMRTTMRVLLVVLGFALTARIAGATVVKGVSLERSIRASEAILIGQVVGSRSYEDRDGRILTGFRVRVEEALKGPFRAGDVAEVTTTGGELDGRRLHVPGEAAYRKGERVLVQLERIDGRWHTLGLASGRWTLTRDERGEHLTRDLSQLAVAGPERMSSGPMPLDEFRRLAREAEAGR
jgi:hypothetical protein